MSIERNTTNFKSNHQTKKNNNLYKQNTMAIKKKRKNKEIYMFEDLAGIEKKRRPLWRERGRK
jgi:hypothetical protein